MKTDRKEYSGLHTMTQALELLASLYPSSTYIKKKDRQEYRRLPSLGVASKFPGSISLILGALICLLANVEVIWALPSPEGGGRNDRRELAATVTYSFAYTGAFETWYKFTTLYAI